MACLKINLWDSKHILNYRCPAQAKLRSGSPDKGSYPEKKICFDLDIVQGGRGGLTQIQIVRGAIKKIAFFSAKFLVGVQDGRGGGVKVILTMSKLEQLPMF